MALLLLKGKRVVQKKQCCAKKRFVEVVFFKLVLP